jgi:cyclic beta-1,2-glucan synthetase
MWTTLAYAQLGDGDMAGELFSLLNPINHSSTRAGIHRYKVEPYVVCADVYTAASHVGRGGWTWYTGSAAWMYRTAIEGMLGFHVRGNRLNIDPCIPRTWPSLEITYQYRSSRYVIEVSNPHGLNRGVQSLWLDDLEIAAPLREIDLHDDSRTHRVRLIIG